MRMTVILGFLASCFAAARTLLVSCTERVLSFVDDVMRPDPFFYADRLPGMPMEIVGHALAPDAVQAMRHEAGVHRVSAARNT